MGLGVPGCMGTKAYPSLLEECVGTVGRSGVAEREPAWTEEGKGKPVPAVFSLG